MENVKMGKVLTFTTIQDAVGNSSYVITPIPANRSPEMEFSRLGLTDRIESYELSAVMPLPMAMMFAMQKACAQGIQNVTFIKW